MGSKRTEFIARGLILDGGRVLLCQNVKVGYFYLPGGHVEFAERAADALAREIDEEMGLVAKVGAPLLVTEQAFEARGKTHHELNVMFHVEQLSEAGAGDGELQEGGPDLPEVRSREDDISFEWVELAALPEIDLRPIEIKAWLVAGGGRDGQLEWISGIA